MMKGATILHPSWLALYILIYSLRMAGASYFSFDDEETEPCDATTDISICCQGDDAYLSNSLCLNQEYDKSTLGASYRSRVGSSTDLVIHVSYLDT
ncbi:hypothetical protein GGS21DRAFT_527970 [Xylaria nigripes]|nr:hypothetical protein GGS21DRAFT_527970 [Xylaria nigripes]